MDEKAVVSLIMKLICGISFIVYIIAFVVVIKMGSKIGLSQLVYLQLIITCMIHSFSYLLPYDNEALCLTQAMLNTFGDLSKLTMATEVVFLAQLNFVNSTQLEAKKKRFLIIGGIVAWALPFIIGILSVVKGGTNSYSHFCWINHQTVIFIFIGIRIVCLITYYLITFKLVKQVNTVYSKLKGDEYYILFVNRIKKYSILMAFITIVFVIYGSLDILHYTVGYSIHHHFWDCIGVINCLSSPTFIIVFVFDKPKFIYFKNLLLCRKEKYDKLINEPISDDAKDKIECESLDKIIY